MLVDPVPPIAGEELPHIGAGLRFVESPTGYLEELRARHGDTFLLDVFGFQLLFTFGARGLESLYSVEESQASFGLATFDLIAFKTPIEILLDADIRLFYDLLLNKKMPAYVQRINKVVDRELLRWGAEGELEIFDAVRTLEQRVGYALWIADEAAEDGTWERLKESFDALDQERSFVDPGETLSTIKSNKAREYAALNDLYDTVAVVIELHDANGKGDYACIDFLRERFSDSPEPDRTRKTIHNAINANQGFLSNLYAAIAWVLVRLLQHPEVMDKVCTEIAVVRQQFGEDFLLEIDALNRMDYLEQVLMEAVRLAQRSLTLRKVMQPLEFDDGNNIYRVQPGVYLATMLSVTNTQTPELAQFDPDHYCKNKLAASLGAPVHTISTFGHGRHACPAQRFSHHMCKIVVCKILARFQLEALFDNPRPSDKQMGGVSRPAEETFLRYRSG
jgi:hypothetical protein